MSPLSFQQKIGIMADSHGDPESIDKGAVFLKQQDCTKLIHLGDICDSNRFDTADACVDRVRKLGIAAVKGNNDHTLDSRCQGEKKYRPPARNTLVSGGSAPVAHDWPGHASSIRGLLSNDWGCRP